MPAALLAAQRVAKPWGRRQLWRGFCNVADDCEPIGEIWYKTPGDDAPDLLVKYLFTSEKLSVQVHPDDAHARAAGLTRGKDECWLILDAEPDSTIALGTRRPIGREALRQGVMDGSIVDLLDWKPAKAGDLLYARSGTIHAIGAGITLIGIQQNSETTYRLHDYGRPRELHLDEGIAFSDPVPYEPNSAPVRVDSDRCILVEGPKFVVERLGGGRRRLNLSPGAHAILVPVRGNGEVDGVEFHESDCVAMHGPVDLEAQTGSDLLLAYPGDRRI